tara:strand:+ start:127 stop:1077 length:951 start_codon:yes stop_codon:yes gene_type:complete
MEAAERLKISAENLNSMLTTSLQKISDTRKRTRKLKAVSILRKRKKKQETKLEVPSVFKKSVRKIQTKVSNVGGDLFGNILGFVSLLVLGTVITNIDKIQEGIQEAKKKLKKQLEPVVENVKAIFEGIQNFIGVFEGEDREKEYSDLLKTTEDLRKVEEKFLGIKKQSEDLEKIYTDVKDGKYATQRGFSLVQSGELSTGEKFSYDDREKEYEVVGANGEATTYSFEEFFNKYRETDINAIVTKDENFTPTIGLDYSFTSVLNEVGMEEQLTGGSYSNQTYKRALAEKFFLNNSDIEEIENQVIIYQPQRIIVDQE